MHSTRIMWVFSLLGAFLWIAGCTEPEVKPTQDFERIELIDGFIQRVIILMETKDGDGLATLHPQGRGMTQPAIEVLESVIGPRMAIFVDRILLREEEAKVDIHWEFRWAGTTRGPAGPAIRLKRGNATFYLEGELDLKLTAIEGDDPFLAPLIVKTPS